jgi:hypothetical protein
MKIDFASGMTPAQAADGIARALRRNRTETVLGGEARWMLRFNRFFPRWLDRLIARRVRKLYAQEVGWAPPTVTKVGGAHPTEQEVR